MNRINLLWIILTGFCLLLNACTKPLHTHGNHTTQVAESIRDSTAYILRGDSLFPPLTYKIEELGDFNSPSTKLPSIDNNASGNIGMFTSIYSFDQIKDQKYLHFLDGEMLEGKKKEKILKKLEREDVDTIQIIPADEAVELYGQKAAHGAVIIETKKEK